MIDSNVVEALRSKRGTVEVLVDDKWFEIALVLLRRAIGIFVYGLMIMTR